MIMYLMLKSFLCNSYSFSLAKYFFLNLNRKNAHTILLELFPVVRLSAWGVPSKHNQSINI